MLYHASVATVGGFLVTRYNVPSGRYGSIENLGRDSSSVVIPSAVYTRIDGWGIYFIGAFVPWDRGGLCVFRLDRVGGIVSKFICRL